MQAIQSETARRSLVVSVLFCTGLFAASPGALPSTNPVPFINQPLVPETLAPGGPGFTLTVNGTGFVPGSVVNWNGSARTTTFVSSSQLAASILASDIATAGTATVTVTNPGLGSASNALFFDVTSSETSVLFNTSDLATGRAPESVAAADFNADGNMDLALADETDGTLAVILGNGDGTFKPAVFYPAGSGPLFVTAGDWNGDGKLDLVVVNSKSDTLSIFLGDGDGTFHKQKGVPTLKQPYSLAAADYNGDGKLDLAVSSQACSEYPCGPGAVSVFLGNGDGTFQHLADYPTGDEPFSVATGDFSGDGKLDLVVANFYDNTVSILLGNGDGTFQAATPFTSVVNLTSLAAADLNGDGKLDLVVGTEESPDSMVWVLLGNGDGTFQEAKGYATGTGPYSVAIADFNGDGRLDLATSNIDDNTVSILLGNGDGTFQTHTDFAAGPGPISLAAGDFNQDGRMDLALADVSGGVFILLQAPTGPFVTLSTTSLTFATQLVGTFSQKQQVTLTNTGSQALAISSIANAGPDAQDYVQSNNCGTSVAVGASCTISINFHPRARAVRSDAITIADNASGSPQSISLTGTGTVVKLTPASLDFHDVPVGQSSSLYMVTLTNVSQGLVSLGKVTIKGSNPGDFAETNTCGASVGAGASCTVYVTFTPTQTGKRTATLEFVDNGGGSPQTAALSGTGT